MTYRAAATIASLILSVVSASAGAQNGVMILERGNDVFYRFLLDTLSVITHATNKAPVLAIRLSS
jgi:hypothetical protein